MDHYTYRIIVLPRKSYLRLAKKGFIGKRNMYCSNWNLVMDLKKCLTSDYVKMIYLKKPIIMVYRSMNGTARAARTLMHRYATPIRPSYEWVRQITRTPLRHVRTRSCTHTCVRRMDIVSYLKWREFYLIASITDPIQLLIGSPIVRLILIWCRVRKYKVISATNWNKVWTWLT